MNFFDLKFSCNFSEEKKFILLPLPLVVVVVFFFFFFLLLHFRLSFNINYCSINSVRQYKLQTPLRASKFSTRKFASYDENDTTIYQCHVFTHTCYSCNNSLASLFDIQPGECRKKSECSISRS